MTTSSALTRLQRRFGALSPEQVAALDAAAAELGVDTVRLMEVAGFQVARLAWRMVGRRPARIHVVAGHGNNGGDALVAARHLAGWGCAVTALAVADQLTGVVDAQARAAAGAGVALRVAAEPARAQPTPGSVLTIDGLLGTGLRGVPRPLHEAAIEHMRGPVLSIDVPSGLDAGTGDAAGPVVTATATCTLAACKRGLWARAAVARVGDLHVADIGMPRTAWARCGLVPPSAVRAGTLRRVTRPRAIT